MLRDFTLPFGTLLALCLSWRIGHSSYRRLIYQAALTSRTDTGVAIVELVRPLERDLGAVQTQFQESGYTILRDVLPPSLTASLLAEAQLIFRERQGADRLPRVPVNAMYSAWLESSTLRRFWSTSNISAGLAHVFTSATLRLLDDVVIVTEPSKMAYGCWHSDWYSFGSVAKETHHSAYSVWIPLVDVPARTRGGSIQLCGRRDVPPNCTDVDFDAEAQVAGQVGRGESWCEKHMSQRCEVPDFRAGDAVLFAADMVHRTQALRDPTFQRYALIGRFVGPDARYQQRKTSFLNHHTYKVQHDMCDHGLRQADPFRGPCFPQVFPVTAAGTGELESERRYINRLLAAALAKAERVWYGGILPD